MRRLVLALLAGALAFAPDASARTLIVDFAEHGAFAGSNGALFARRVVEGELTKVGEDFLVVPYSATKIEWVRNGYHVIGWNPTTARGAAIDQCDAVILVNWLAQIDARFDSLTRGASTGKWPNKPMAIIGPNTYGGGKWVQATGCSTGVASNNAAVAVPALSYAYYNAQGDQVWRTGGAQMIVAAAAARPPGVFKALIAYGVAYNYITAAGIQLCTDCDAVVRATSAAAESVAVWERGRSTLEPNPIVFADLGNALRPELAFIVISRLNGATGGKIIKRPVRVGIAASGYMQTGSAGPSINPASPGAGPYIPASGLVDSLNQQGSADSVAAKRLKMVLPVSVNADTLAAPHMAVQARLLRRFGPTVKLTPQDYAGVHLNFTSSWFGIPTRGVQISGRSNKQMISDVWGVSRARNWTRANGTTCAPGDTGSSACLLEWSLWRADSLSRALGLGGVDRVIWAPSMDWTPSDITRENAVKLDSVLAAAARAGVKGFYTTPYTLDSSPDLYLSPATHPLGWGHTERTFQAVDPGTRAPLGRIALLATRGFEALANSSPTTNHDLLGEFLLGWLTGGPWIWGAEGMVGPSPGPLLYHDLYQTFSVLTVSANSLGGTGDGTNPRRHGWWAIKGLSEIVSTANSYSPNTTIKPAEIVYPEQLATEAR